MNDPIADVEFEVFYDGDSWVAREWRDLPARQSGGKYRFVGRGSTPITALMVAEAKARKGAR